MSKRLEQIETPKASTELAYLAGYFDGEGCIRLDSTEVHSLHVTIVSADKSVLTRFVTSFGGKLTAVKKRKAYYRDLWHWSACNTDAQAILLQLIPYLDAKLNQAMLAIIPEYKRENVGRGHKVPELELKTRELVFQSLKTAKSTFQGQKAD